MWTHSNCGKHPRSRSVPQNFQSYPKHVKVDRHFKGKHMTTLRLWPFIRDFLYESLFWLFFSVLLALSHVWIGVLVYRLQGVPFDQLYLQNVKNGSLLGFTIVLMASAWGHYFKVAERDRWTSLYCTFVGVLGIGSAVVAYSLLLSSAITGGPVDFDLLSNMSLALGATAILYGFILNLRANMARGT